MPPIQNFADTFVINLRFSCLMFAASTSYFMSFPISVSQLVPETLTKADFCHFSFTRLWSAALSQNSPLLNIKLETAQVNVIEIEKSTYSFLSSPIIACLYAHSAIVSTISVYNSLIHPKACKYEHYKDYENKCFSLHSPLWNIIICLPLDTS